MHAHHHWAPPPRAKSRFARVPAGIKFAVTLAIVVGCSVLPPQFAWWFILPAACVVVLLLASGLPLLATLKRLILLEPFVLGVALLAMFMPGSWQERWVHFAFLMSRCTVSLLCLILFTGTTLFSELLALFRTLHLPGLLVTTLALMHRYLFVLADESSRMRRARASRSFSPKRSLSWRTLSTIIAQLFLRASDRADRIYNAMQARGWDAGE